jgi:nucleoside-diphosphate-sugar epimerase
LSSTFSYLRGKTILLTGGTGFLGKVIIERLLRHAPDLARIYVLVRPQHSPSAPPIGVATRFETEIVGSAIFDSLAREHGDGWLAFALEKMMPVAGDVSQPRLGLADRQYHALTDRVDIVVNAAASVTFDAAIDEALRHNTASVHAMAAFARACRSAVIVHVSTAYVAGPQTGTILEGPVHPDIANAEISALGDAARGIHEAAAAEGWSGQVTRNRLIEAGMQRAKRLGWHDTYTYTKALGEMVLVRERGDVPTAIVRPSIIESSLRAPEPGWIENLNVADPLWVEYGRGRMTEFPLGLGSVLDLIPVDFVANAILAILPRVAATREVGYYAIGSGCLNPITGGGVLDLTHEYFRRHPMRDRRGNPIRISRLVVTPYAEFQERFAARAQRSAMVKRLLYLADLYHTYMNANCVFDTSRTQRVLDELEPGDRAVLDFDVRHIDWRHYLQDVHLPGLRRHVLRDDARASVRGHA